MGNETLNNGHTECNLLLYYLLEIFSIESHILKLIYFV